MIKVDQVRRVIDNIYFRPLGSAESAYLFSPTRLS